MRKVTEDFIGTCQHCFGEYKVHETSAQIVLHGYKRPGDGFIHSECGGTGFPPFEYSCTETEAVIDRLHRRIATSRAWLGKLQDGSVTKLTRTWSEANPDDKWGPNIKKSETIGPDSEHWARTLKSTIANTENSITYDEGTVAYFEMRVAAWERLPIVGIDLPATGKSRVLRKAYDPVEAAIKAERDAAKAARAAKPGKLIVTVYRKQPERPDHKVVGEDAFRAHWEKMDAAKKAWATAIRTWVKGNFEGKTMVREGYSSDLPKGLRNAPGFYDVFIINLPWDFRDEIATRFPNAVQGMNENKRHEWSLDAADTNNAFPG